MTSWRNWIAWRRGGPPNFQRVGAEKEPLPEGALSLRTRLILTVAVALLPIAVVSALQGMERARVDVANARERLVQSARVAASREENVLASGEQVLRALSGIDDVRDVTARCDQALADALIGIRFYTNLSRVDRNGIVVCSALPRAKNFDVGRLPVFRAARDDMRFAVSGQIISPVTHNPVIGAMLPLRDARGKFAGAVGFAVDVRWLDHILRSREMPGGSVAAVFDRSGTVMAANNSTVARAIFSAMPQAATLRGGLQSRKDARGDSWTFTAAPLVGDNIFVGFAMRDALLFGPTYWRVGADFLLPIFMVGFAWAAIWWATERWITRWIEYLRGVAAAYRGGYYALRPDLADAPAELRLLGSAMEKMATGIEDRDKSLRDALAQKTFLIREAHHRVKNNLQVVISLLSLQSKQSREPGIQDALNLARARIDALALVHRLLNDIEDQTTVDLPRLLRELTSQIVDAMTLTGDDIEVTVDVVPGHVPGEIAVPLALFCVEALTNTFKHAFPDERKRGAVKLSLAHFGGGKLRLLIEDDGIGFASAQAHGGMGERLLSVFGRQIDGKLKVESASGRGTSVELILADPNAVGTAQSAAAAE